MNKIRIEAKDEGLPGLLTAARDYVVLAISRVEALPDDYQEPMQEELASYRLVRDVLNKELWRFEDTPDDENGVS